MVLKRDSSEKRNLCPQKFVSSKKYLIISKIYFCAINPRMSGKLTSTDIGNLDRQLEQLYECKILTEAEIKVLCDKVHLFALRKS